MLGYIILLIIAMFAVSLLTAVLTLFLGLLSAVGPFILLLFVLMIIYSLVSNR